MFYEFYYYYLHWDLGHEAQLSLTTIEYIINNIRIFDNMNNNDK